MSSAKPGAAAPLGELGRAGAGRGFGVAVGHRRERREPGLHLREVLVPAGEVEVAERHACAAGSRTTITCHAWRFPPLGANLAVSSTRYKTSSETGLSVKSRTAPVLRRAWLSSMVVDSRRT